MFQRVSLIGNVGQDPQMRYTPGGIPVTNFSVATTTTRSKARVEECPKGWKESYNGKNWQLTTWWRVAVWYDLAETVNQYVTKGQQVYVEGGVTGNAEGGTLNPNVWTGKDGVAKASYEITSRMVKFLGSRNGSSTPPSPQDEDAPMKISGVPQEDDLPF